MANMAYCRFRNTLADLRDCAAELDELDDLSTEEAKARESLLLLCKRIADDFEHDIQEIMELREQRRAAALAKERPADAS